MKTYSVALLSMVLLACSPSALFAVAMPTHSNEEPLIAPQASSSNVPPTSSIAPKLQPMDRENTRPDDVEVSTTGCCNRSCCCFTVAVVGLAPFVLPVVAAKYVADYACTTVYYTLFWPYERSTKLRLQEENTALDAANKQLLEAAVVKSEAARKTESDLRAANKRMNDCIAEMKKKEEEEMKKKKEEEEEMKKKKKEEEQESERAKQEAHWEKTHPGKWRKNPYSRKG